ncbi:MAG: 4-hydroxythreonine-4-phosphate dehydrogenase PdxA [Planctomycetes bacterium]|nr:4-hydroxythreonine-4-phosphate dehydrogenase PdxA [Planctomycetota bacterium]
MDSKPRLAITLGDPAGIGPEVIVAAWRHAALHTEADLLVTGRPEILARAIALLNSPARVVEIRTPAEARSSLGEIPCLLAGSKDAVDVPPCVHDARGGQAAYDALNVACRLAIKKQVAGIVTAPLSKAALSAAGHDYPGHTELLADMCGVDDSAMMLYLPPQDGVGGPAGLGVVHATLHMALRDVPHQLNTARILACAKWADDVMRRLDVEGHMPGAPRIGVCSLNPHAGEQGLFGDEEQRIIEPAIQQAAAAGICIQGPLPADTLMMRARDGEFDAVVAMFHDQGHVALKLLGMHRAVNITLGLPIVRTSVAHGTAFDRAWQGTAECEGMIAAVRVAARLARATQGTPA